MNGENEATKKCKAELQIFHNFKYHAPKPGQPETYTAIRDKAKELALFMNESCPQSRELSLALTKLEESVMWANASIARAITCPPKEG